MYGARQADLTQRLQAAADVGACLVVLTLTAKSFDLGRLGQQLDVVQTVWRKAKDGSPYRRLVERHRILGSLWALHPEFSKGAWHAHLHVVVAVLPSEGRDVDPDEHPVSVREAAAALAERYCRLLQAQGLPTVPNTVAISPPRTIDEIAKYFPNIWKAGFTKGGGVYALLRAAFEGDESARQAYVELAHTLHCRSLIRGSGVLRGGL